MMKRILVGTIAFVLLYAGVIQLQVLISNKNYNSVKLPEQDKTDAMHKVYSFSFSKYTTDGKKEIEIEGSSADILSQTVDLINVVAKAYAEEIPVTITADTGKYNKAENKVHLQENVVATTADGTRLLSEQLDIHPEKKTMETTVEVQVKKDNINIEGLGAKGDSQLKKVKFKKNVTVVIQSADSSAPGLDGAPGKGGPTVITCDGPLDIDYAKNIAHFHDNVVAEDSRGKLLADAMDVYYNKVSSRVSKIVGLGNVVIENPDGNKTYSDSVIYLAEEGRIILGGDTEALVYEEPDNSSSSTDPLSGGLF